MPAAVIPIGARRPLKVKDRGYWSLLEVAQPGRRPVPYGILLADRETGELTLRLADLQLFEELDEQDIDFLEALSVDLDQKGREMGGLRLMDWLEDGLSHFLRVSDREAIAYDDARETVDRLFDEHVDATVRPFISHLPVYSLRAAATKFGEGMESEQEGWVRAPENLRLSQGMFVAYVVGRSMEPLIPDGSACVFRAPVAGSRKGRLLLIEKAGETDFASRYTVKRYARQGVLAESADREGAIRLEPLNREFSAFDLTSDEFRVIAEFVQVLRS
jgi:phage repressor protein C with HTH and peptisase S24 domain